MKSANQTLAFLFLLFTSTNFIFAQNEQEITKSDTSKIFIIVKHDGTQFVGNILSQDAREVLIETKETGQVIIPKHEIKEIRELKANELSSSGTYTPAEVFSTRYFITTNGLPIEKKESYVQWNLFGPDFQFGVGKNFGLGIMTSWFAIPIIGTAKYSIRISENVNLGVGALLGTGSWTAPDFGIALPFSSLTFGDRKRNITFSGGYGAIFDDNGGSGRTLFSIAGLVKAGKKICIVFDSFIVPPGEYYTYDEYQYDPVTGNTTITQARKRRAGLALLIPGIRWQIDSEKAFQFGFAGLSYDREFVPSPIPMVQWYRKL